MLEGVGLRFCLATDKAVPECIFHLSQPYLALFLKTLFTCDGNVYINGHGEAGVSYSTISLRLAEDVQHLLLRFGLIATLRTKRSQVNGAAYTAHEVVLLGTAVVQNFLASIGIMGRSATCARVAAMSRPALSSTRRDTVPTGEVFWRQISRAMGDKHFTEVSRQAGVKFKNRRHEQPLCRETMARLAAELPSPYLYALGCGDVYWDEIKSITPAGEAMVYDITVPGKANFVANDLIIHNSTLLLELCADQAQARGPVLYVSGEESAAQTKLRAARIGIAEPRSALESLGWKTLPHRSSAPLRRPGRG